MKMRILLCCALAFITPGLTGCGGTSAPPADSDATPAAADDGMGGTDADEADDDASLDDLPSADGTPSEDFEERTDFSFDTDSADEFDSRERPSDGANFDADDAESEAADDEDSDELSMEQFQKKLQQAMTAEDFELAMRLMDSQIEAYPDDISLKVTQLALRVGVDPQLAGDDEAVAAKRFLETAELADKLEPMRDKISPQLGQFFVQAAVNGARGHAVNGDATKALESLVSAAKGGMSTLSWMEEDSFFAKIRDNAEFAPAAFWKRVAKAEIADFESFDFAFSLPDLDGETVTLGDMQGKVSIVDIWGTWCPPCRKEIPHFIKLQETYADDLAIVGVNYENAEGDEAIAEIRKFIEETPINYTCVIGDEATRSQVPNFEGFPTTLFIDREGKVRLKVVGYHPYEKLDAYVNALLSDGA